MISKSLRYLRRRMYQMADATMRRDVNPAPAAIPATASFLMCGRSGPLPETEEEVLGGSWDTMRMLATSEDVLE